MYSTLVMAQVDYSRCEKAMLFRGYLIDEQGKIQPGLYQVLKDKSLSGTTETYVFEQRRDYKGNFPSPVSYTFSVERDDAGIISKLTSVRENFKKLGHFKLLDTIYFETAFSKLQSRFIASIDHNLSVGIEADVEIKDGVCSPVKIYSTYFDPKNQKIVKNEFFSKAECRISDKLDACRTLIP